MEAIWVDPVWIILSVLAVASWCTYWNTKQNNKALDRYRTSQERIQADYMSSQILSDMLKTTREFRTAIDHLILGDNLTGKDQDDLVRVMTYLTALNFFRQDGLVKDRHVGVIYGPMLEKLTDKKMEKILGCAPGWFKHHPEYFLGIRTMRDQLA